jgi:hypothetical protein
VLHQKESSLFSLQNCFVCRQESKNKSLAFAEEEEEEEERRLSRPSVSVLLLQDSETCRKKKQRDKRIADLVYASFFVGVGGGGCGGRNKVQVFGIFWRRSRGRRRRRSLSQALVLGIAMSLPRDLLLFEDRFFSSCSSSS